MNTPGPLAVLRGATRSAKHGTLTAETLAAVLQAARQGLVAAVTTEDLKLVRDKVAAFAQLLAQQRAYQVEVSELLDVKLDAERRLGAALARMVTPGSHERKLPRAISYRQSALWQRLARVPDELSP